VWIYTIWFRYSRADDAFSHWTNNGFTVDVPGDNSGVSGDACFKCVGISDGVKSLSQTIYPSTRESYTFSGKIAFESIELGSNGGIVLEVEFTYDDGAVETKEFDLY
jgi:hypothetical protein